MTPLLAIPFGLMIGTSLGLLGGGGSILALPVLVYVFGKDVHAAATASLLVVATGAVVSGADYHCQGRVCWRQTAAVTSGAVPAVFAGTALADAVGANMLLAGFALVMLPVAVVTWRTSVRACAGQVPVATGTCPPLRLWPAVATGVALGLLTGFFGVGGGFLIVPALFVVLGLSMRHAVGTSLAVIAVTAGLGLLVHLGAGRALDIPLALAMTGACAVGALGGVALAPHVRTVVLGQGLAALIALVAVYLLASTLFLGGPPTP